MSTKPTTLPTWATDGGTTLEPSGSQKAAGFAVATRPPAKWVNWLLNNLYTWMQYLNAPTSSSSAAALEGANSSTGAGLKGSNTGSGPGVHGYSGGGSGYGVVAEADASLPSKASLRVVPQDADPSSPDAGAVRLSTVGVHVAHSSTLWSRVVGYVLSLWGGNSSPIVLANSGGTGWQTFAGGSVALPAGALTQGSKIEVRVVAQEKISGYTGDINLRVFLDDGSTSFYIAETDDSTPVDNEWRTLANDVFIVEGAGATQRSALIVPVDYSQAQDTASAGGYFNPANAVTLSVQARFTSGSNTASLELHAATIAIVDK